MPFLSHSTYHVLFLFFLGISATPSKWSTAANCGSPRHHPIFAPVIMEPPQRPLVIDDAPTVEVTAEVTAISASTSSSSEEQPTTTNKRKNRKETGKQPVKRQSRSPTPQQAKVSLIISYLPEIHAFSFSFSCSLRQHYFNIMLFSTNFLLQALADFYAMEALSAQRERQQQETDRRQQTERRQQQLEHQH